ncbi:response regulator transcription factor [Alkalitalea saponilacus]|uniref:DNA-binding response regulator, OmpR family, contains REC and winged-helix (WHTH) domain n=1 Tax=Alkalitalea saponilacus TaxID=889453 RepID=A0A1T5C8R9_9BACT|nr:response regulator transcription factor [Alkalitalea saponilacus]ASB49774.1 DNA-binding response regulator [Alkalitalea saponilacus]SKB55824.1 DNA-binding response regulator, OmpR family, contains REC and winged-helix (wHTH) domain [Alkalitalea saponilacus]
MHKILIIEDEQRIATLIKRGLEENNCLADVAYDGETGKKLALRSSYDLIITDIILPKINGIDLCRELREHLPNTPIIMLTALGTTDDKVEGFDAGADDYLVKPFDFRELFARIRTLLKRYNQLENNNSEVLNYADLELNIHTKLVKRDNQEIHLTPKEFKLLEYMLRNKERVLSRTEIAQNVWETHFDTGTNFIDVYINYLRNKIDKKFPTKLIHTKSGMGFILKDKL